MLSTPTPSVLRTVIVAMGEADTAELGRTLASSNGLLVVATLTNASTAPRVLRGLEVDVVVVALDPAMAPPRGILDELGHLSAALVLCSPSRADAARAFEVGAIDFWTTGREGETLARTVGRVRALQRTVWDARIGRRVIENLRPGGGAFGVTRVALRSEGMMVLVAPDTIRTLEAVGNYVRVVHASGPTLVRSTLGALARQLGDRFIRVHRSHVVPFDRIRALRRSRSGRDVVLDDGSTVPLGRRYVARLERRLSNAPVYDPDTLLRFQAASCPAAQPSDRYAPPTARAGSMRGSIRTARAPR